MCELAHGRAPGLEAGTVVGRRSADMRDAAAGTSVEIVMEVGPADSARIVNTFALGMLAAAVKVAIAAAVVVVVVIAIAGR